jgi:hypothetical protein
MTLPQLLPPLLRRGAITTLRGRARPAAAAAFAPARRLHVCLRDAPGVLASLRARAARHAELTAALSSGEPLPPPELARLSKEAAALAPLAAALADFDAAAASSSELAAMAAGEREPEMLKLVLEELAAADAAVSGAEAA